MAAGYMTADEARAHHASRPDRPGTGSYIAAVLVPLAGFILAIKALAKDKIGPGLALALTAWVAMTIWAGVFFAVAYDRVADSLSSSDTSSLIDTSSPVDPSSTANGGTEAGGGSGTFSADDTDGDGVSDDLDAYPFDYGKQ
jgi:hypothetical protein